jgi:hypothetical protein
MQAFLGLPTAFFLHFSKMSLKTYSLNVSGFIFSFGFVVKVWEIAKIPRKVPGPREGEKKRASPGWREGPVSDRSRRRGAGYLFLIP